MTDKPFTVLLVEDSPLLSDRIMELLSAMPGITPLVAVDTEAAAIAAIETQNPDAILLDLSLKQGTGFGVMRHINRLSDKQPAVIVISNYALPQYRKEAKFLGAKFFLDKSQDLDLIPETLNALKQKQEQTL
ncbi:MAG: response regulator [Steroidobacteraceae bacterium]